MATSMWMSLTDKYTKEGKDDVLQDFITGMREKQVSLIEMVECLGPCLTSSEVRLRVRGTQLLTEIITSLAPNQLTPKEGNVCVVFMTQRLRDHHSITPFIIKALLALCQQQHLSQPDVASLVRSIFAEVMTQSLSQADRRNVYTLFLHLLEHRLQDVLALSGDFVFGFVQAMDGEKDPRNLLLAFRCVTLIAKNFDLGVFCEELFEVVSCYFPIEFTPPPNDPNAITQEELVIQLRECLSASHSFAEFGYPLFLEKLTSDMKSSKLDALRTLSVCMPVYGPKALEEYTSSILNAIRRNVFMGLNIEVTECSLETLTVMVRTLATAMETSVVTEFINEIWQGCRPYFQEADEHSIASSCQLLDAAARGDKLAAQSIVKSVLSHCVKDILSNTQASKRKCLLDTLSLFLGLANQLGLASSAAVMNHAEEIFTAGATLVTDPNPQLRQCAVRLLQTLVAMTMVLDAPQRHLVANHFIHIVKSDSDASVRGKAVEALVSFARSDPDTVLDKVLPVIASYLSLDVAMETDDIPAAAAHMTRSYVIKTLADLSVHPLMVERTVPLILSCITDAKQASVDEGTLMADSLVCCQSLQEITSRETSSAAFYVDWLYHHCVDLCVMGACGEPGVVTSVLQGTELLQHLAATFSNIVRIQTSSVAQGLVDSTLRLFLHGEYKPTQDTLSIDTANFKPLQVESPSCQTQLLCVLQAVLCSAHREVVIPELDSLMNQLLAMSCVSSHVTSSNAASRCFAGILNKTPAGDELENLVSLAKRGLESRLASDEDQQSLVIFAFSWLTKALVLRGHSVQSTCLLRLCSWLASPRIGCIAAEGFRIVLEPAVNIMTAPQHAIITLLYPQRVFITTLPLIQQAYLEATGPESKRNHLKALSYLLQFVPKPVVQPELPKLVPLLVQSIQSCDGGDSDAESLSSSLSTLYDLIMESPASLSKNIDDIIPRFLLLAGFKKAMNVRIQSLRCLGAMTTMPLPIIVKHSQAVTRGLVPLLGDHKRLVRKEAVLARTEWILLDSGV